MLPRLTLLLTILLVFSAPTLADEPGQAGLVIQFEGGRVETYCLSFEGAEIRGDDLLARSGLDTIIDPSSGMGITVCKIEDLGCAFPVEHCFCNCMGGGPCAYWNYFFRDPGAGNWAYSALGAVLRQARPGSVEAWVWGDGHTPPAADLTFEAICPPPTPPPPPTAQPPSPTPLSPADPASAQPTAPASPTATPPAASATPAASTETAPVAASYWPFGLVVLGLVAIGVIVWLRRV